MCLSILLIRTSVILNLNLCFYCLFRACPNKKGKFYEEKLPKYLRQNLKLHIGWKVLFLLYQTCGQFHQHFMHSFSLITVRLCNLLAKEYWRKSCLYNVVEIVLSWSIVSNNQNGQIFFSNKFKWQPWCV